MWAEFLPTFFLHTMNWMLPIALCCAFIDWFAVARANRRLEYIFKPATMLAIIAALIVWMQGPHDAWYAWFLLAGFILSLAGDVFLILPDQRYFLFGLVAFLLAHVAYVVAMNQTLPPPVAYLLLLPIGVIGAWYMRRVIRALQNAKQNELIGPVMVYGLAISLMLFSAWATLFRPEWSNVRRMWVILGATLFYVSDVILAWILFMKPFRGAKLAGMITYHLGQIALAAAVVM